MKNRIGSSPGRATREAPGSAEHGSPRPARKDLSLESLRGLALLLMVAGHVIGQTSARGMQVADDSMWRFSYLALADMRMPLFTFLSGFVFALRPAITGAQYPGLIRGKARRVLLPLLTVGTLLFVMQQLVPAVNQRADLSDWWRTYAYGFEHLWFLQAIFLVFVVVGALEASGALSSPRGWLGVMVVTLAVTWLLRLPPAANVFSLNETAYLLPFFLLGYGISRYRPREPVWAIAAISVTCALALAARLLAQAGVWHPSPPVARLLGLVVGCTFVLVLYLARSWLTTPPLYLLGPYAFGVYLLHPFGTASTRIALGQVGVDAHPVVFVAGMVVGVAAPVVVQQATRRVPLLHTALFGEKVRRRPDAQLQTAP